MNEKEKLEKEKLMVDALLGDKEDNVRGEMEWIEFQRKKNDSAETLKWLKLEHEEQLLDIITSWRAAGDAVTLAANLVVRAQAAMDRQGWWFRFEEHRCGEREDKVAQVKKGLNLAERGIEAMVEALRAVEFPDTFADVELGGKESE